MMKKTSIMAACAVAFSASMAAAEEHVIIYLGQAFFPSVTHVQPGDTIRFVNSSEITTMIESETAVWSVGPLIAAEEGTATVESAMELVFFATEVTGADEDEIDADDTTDDTNTVTVEGALSFEAPPA